MDHPPEGSSDRHDGGKFTETRWSIVLRAGKPDAPGAAEALENLCRSYWYPVYAWIRRSGRDAEESRDLTQEFIATLLRRNSLESVSPDKGRFRTFLIRSIGNFLTDKHRLDTAACRGGGNPVVALDVLSPEALHDLLPASHDTPAAAFDRGWAKVLLANAFERLKAEQSAAGRTAVFDAVRGFVGGPPEAGEYRQVADQFGLTENAITVTVHRLRRRCRELIMEEIMQTVGSRIEAEEELRALFGGAASP